MTKTAAVRSASLLIKQPHGGALLQGGVNGHKGGTGRPSSAIRKLLLGKGTADSPTRSWDGMIDEFRIYGRALTAAEIAAIHAHAPPQAQPRYNFPAGFVLPAGAHVVIHETSGINAGADLYAGFAFPTNASV